MSFQFLNLLSYKVPPTNIFFFILSVPVCMGIWSSACGGLLPQHVGGLSRKVVSSEVALVHRKRIPQGATERALGR